MEALQTVVCTFPRGNGRLRYSFSAHGSVDRFIVRFRTGTERSYDDGEQNKLYRRLRADPLFEAPVGITEIETGYDYRYDTLYSAMRLLGHAPVRPHRSRTYWTAIANPGPHNFHVVFHRFAFKNDGLQRGLAELFETVYGLAPSIERV